MGTRSEFARERSGQPGPGTELDLSGIGRALRQRRAWIITPALVCCIAAILFVSAVKPRYTGEAKVLIENGESFFTRPDKTDTQQVPLLDDEAVQSQVQLVSSRDLAREAIKRLGLKGNPEFDPLAGGLSVVGRLLVLFGLEHDPTAVSPEDRILNTYFDRLKVFPVIKSRVLTIEFTSSDPDLAARGANTIADLYIEAQSDAKRASAHAAAESLATLLASLRNRASEAEARVEAFRGRSGLLLGSNNTSISAQQLTDLTTQLATARTAEADAEAKAKLLRDMIKAGRVADIPDVANNEMIRRLAGQRITLRAEIAQQARTLLPGHPHMQELNAQLQDLDTQLHNAAQNTARTLENDARIAADRVQGLLAALERQKQTVTSSGADQVQLSELELQSRLLKEQLEFNTAKYQEALARETSVSTPADARVISRAVPPQSPSFPKKLPTIAIATLAGLILSIGVIIARELLSGRAFVADAGAPGPLPRDLAEPAPARTAPPAPAPETVPAAPDLPAEPQPFPALAPVASPPGAGHSLVEALRDARRRRLDGRAARLVFAPTGSAPESTRAAIVLARLLTREARTILVSFDGAAPVADHLQVSSFTELPGGGHHPGLWELLTGTASFAEIINRDAASRLHVVFPGRQPLNAEARDSLPMVVDALAETYDYVVLQVPPPGSELTRELALGADAVVLAVQSDARPALVDAARTILENEGSAPILVVPADALIAAGDMRSAA